MARTTTTTRRRCRPSLRLLTGASLAALLLVAGCGGKVSSVDKAGGPVTAAPINLKMANTRGEEAQRFLDELAKISGGALQLSCSIR